MLMKPEHLKRLINIWQRPGLSLLSQLLIARRVARQYDEEQRLDRLVVRSHTKVLSAGFPFTRSRLAELTESARRSREARRDARAAIGHWVVLVGGAIEETIGVARICDALSVNPVHRGEVSEAGPGEALDYLAFVAGLEESAAQLSGRRAQTFKRGGLFQCVLERMLAYGKEHPGALPDPIAPGGPLYGLPVTELGADGLAKVTRAALTVHSRDGTSRVVKRKPEVRRG